MRITFVDEECIEFNNGNRIVYEGAGYLGDLPCSALDEDFDEDLVFENAPGVGFKFGNKGKPLNLVPGYPYTEDDTVAVVYSKAVLCVECEEVIE